MGFAKELREVLVILNLILTAIILVTVIVFGVKGWLALRDLDTPTPEPIEPACDTWTGGCPTGNTY